MFYFHRVCIFMFVFETTLSLENAPKCYSRYDYEEKLMMKTVKNDFQMNQILEKFDKTLTELQATKADFDSANAHLQTLIEGVKENISNEIEEKLKSNISNEIEEKLKGNKATKADFDSANAHLQTLIQGVKENISNEIEEKLKSNISNEIEEKLKGNKDAARQPVILFNARILKNKRPGRGSRLVYTTIAQNIGDAFNQDTGIFTAPVNGTYLFSAQFCTPQQKWGAVEIVVKGEAVHSIVK